MNSKAMGISAGGRERLLAAVEHAVRREFERELSNGTQHWEKAVLERKIKDEVKKRMERVASPQSLWNAL
jgi:hypothetical protein